MTPEDYIKKIKSFPKDQELMKSMTVTAAMLCCSDGTVDNAEIKKVKELGQTFFKDKFDFKEFEEQLKLASEYNYNSVHGKKIVKLTSNIYKRHSKLPQEEKLQIYAFFSEIALSDGNVDPNEQVILDLISENLKIKNPFNYNDILNKQKSNKKETKEENSKFSNDFEETFTNASNAFGMLARMVVQGMIEGNMIHKSLEIEAILAAIKVLTQKHDLAMKILSKNESEMVNAYIIVTDEIFKELGITKKPQYSSTIYADTEEELLKKKRAVNIYASLGLLSIFGFLGSFGYAIYLFFNNGNFILWVIIGFVLMFFQKWVGKKHDALTG